MEEVNLVTEIERLESMYNHYRKLYRRVRFLYEDMFDHRSYTLNLSS